MILLMYRYIHVNVTHHFPRLFRQSVSVYMMVGVAEVRLLCRLYAVRYSFL